MQKTKTYTDRDYTVNEYDNGTIERYLTGSDVPIESGTQPTEQEIQQAELGTSIEYNNCLQEMVLGMK